MNKDRAFAFSGLMFSGKDFVANATGLQLIGFADPIYVVVRQLTGTSDKSVPGIRSFMQAVGQWGWGAETPKYPWNPERAMFVEKIRKEGSELFFPFEWINWRQYGLRKDFWVYHMLMRLGLNHEGAASGYETALASEIYRMRGGMQEPLAHVVTNARFHHEMAPLKKAGFQHYHVMCSEETRLERMAKAGYKPIAADIADDSEAMARDYNETMPDEFVIWNDHRPMPQGRNFLMAADFLINNSLSV